MAKEPSNGQRKGARRQRLHAHQNNHFANQNEPTYKAFDGQPEK